MIRLKCWRRVKPDVKAESRRIVDGFARVSKVTRPVSIGVVPADTVGEGVGVCIQPIFKTDTVIIYVAGRIPDNVQKATKATREEALAHFAKTILHELAHYEQIRDGRTVTERGTQNRANSLYRRIAVHPLNTR